MIFSKSKKKQQAAARAQEQAMSAVEKRLKKRTMPATEEPNPANPGASAHEYYEYSANVMEKSELFFVALWLTAEFYCANKGMGEEYIQNAITIYQQLIRSFFSSNYPKSNKAEILSEYFNADEAVLRICDLYCLDLKQPLKALPYFSNYLEKFPHSKYLEHCREQINVIKENKGDAQALILYLQAASEHNHQRYSQARSGFENIVKKHSESKLALLAELKLGDILFFQEKKLKAAAEAYTEAIDRWGVNDLSSRALYQLGECCRARSDWQEAIEHYGRYISDGGTKFRLDWASFYMGVCHEHLGHWDEAQACYEDVLATDKGYWRQKASKRTDEIKSAREKGTLDLLSETLRVREKSTERDSHNGQWTG